MSHHEPAPKLSQGQTSRRTHRNLPFLGMVFPVSFPEHPVACPQGETLNQDSAEMLRRSTYSTNLGCELLTFLVVLGPMVPKAHLLVWCLGPHVPNVGKYQQKALSISFPSNVPGKHLRVGDKHPAVPKDHSEIIPIEKPSTRLRLLLARPDFLLLLGRLVLRSFLWLYSS